jgi:hypothetical protein
LRELLVRDDDIAALVCSKLDAGELPAEAAESVWGGSGHGERCAACDERITDTDDLISVDHPDGVRRNYHTRCHGITAKVRLRRILGAR